jgi:hypothetical protein
MIAFGNSPRTAATNYSKPQKSTTAMSAANNIITLRPRNFRLNGRVAALSAL